MSEAKPRDRVVLFPGQGSQVVGMASDLVERWPAAREVFDRARERTGTDFLTVCRDGPAELLDSTRMSQPAIYLHSMAVVAALRQAGVLGATDDEPLATAGLSLGEYSALVYAGALELEDALDVVVRRGEFMQEACDSTDGGMVSIIGLPAAAVEEHVARLRADEGLEVAVANYNSPIQTVISGRRQDLEAATGALAGAGAKKTVPLRVAGAYHSALMSSATVKLAPFLRELAIRQPAIPFFSNVTGARVDDPEEIRAVLLRQIESSVRWEPTVRALLDAGATRAWELGPGKVLKGLVRNVDRQVSVSPVGSADDIEELRTEHTAS